MLITVESAEVATLKPDGRPWDGPGGPRLPAEELASFFAQPLTGQLERLVALGGAPTPPDVFVRILSVGERDPFLESGDQKSFDPRYATDPAASASVDLGPGDRIRLRVLDRDVLFDDLIGEVEVPIPERPAGGSSHVIGPFGQVRRLVLRFDF